MFTPWMTVLGMDMEYLAQIFLVTKGGESCPGNLITFIWKCYVTTATAH